MTLLDNMPHTCEVIRMRFTRTPGQMGNVEDPEVVFGNDPDDPLFCWVQNASSSEILEWAKRSVNITHRINFRTDFDLQLGDEIRVTGGLGFLGQLFKVQTHMIDRSAGFGQVFRAMVEIER